MVAGGNDCPTPKPGEDLATSRVAFRAVLMNEFTVPGTGP